MGPSGFGRNDGGLVAEAGGKEFGAGGVEVGRVGSAVAAVGEIVDAVRENSAARASTVATLCKRPQTARAHLS